MSNAENTSDPVSDEQLATESSSHHRDEYARLVFRSRDGQTIRKNILRTTTLIGSAAGCNIQLISKTVAEAHCVVTLDSGVLRIRDLRSKTGIKVNGNAMEVAELHNGDHLEIGRFAFLVECKLFADSDGRDADQHEPSKTSTAPLNAAGTEVNGGRLMVGHFPGFFIDGYKVIDVLGIGGMGWTYCAEDPEIGRQVALKVLPETSDQGIRARFELEAQAALRLKHPNVVRTYKLAHTEDVYYMVQEFVEGIALNELIEQQGPIPWQKACYFMMQIAKGLHHCHESGIIHRDVKPGNILITHDGTAKLLDFGLALDNNCDDEFSLAMIFGHDCLGTADYMPPEQSLDSFAVDARADIYSLGCTLYTALSGRVPFPAKSVSDKLECHRKKLPRPVTDFVKDVPPELIAVLTQMMAKNPDKRYQTASRVAIELSRFAQETIVEFDFEQVLNSRSEWAKKRISTMSGQIVRSRSGASGRPASNSRGASKNDRPGSTMVR